MVMWCNTILIKIGLWVLSFVGSKAVDTFISKVFNKLPKSKQDELLEENERYKKVLLEKAEKVLKLEKDKEKLSKFTQDMLNWAINSTFKKIQEDFVLVPRSEDNRALKMALNADNLSRLSAIEELRKRPIK